MIDVYAAAGFVVGFGLVVYVMFAFFYKALR